MNNELRVNYLVLPTNAPRPGDQIELHEYCPIEKQAFTNEAIVVGYSVEIVVRYLKTSSSTWIVGKEESIPLHLLNRLLQDRQLDNLHHYEVVKDPMSAL